MSLFQKGIRTNKYDILCNMQFNWSGLHIWWQYQEFSMKATRAAYKCDIICTRTISKFDQIFAKIMTMSCIPSVDCCRALQTQNVFDSIWNKVSTFTKYHLYAYMSSTGWWRWMWFPIMFKFASFSVLFVIFSRELNEELICMR